MKSYISIIYVKPNTLTTEKIAVGIIYFSKEEAKIIFSEKKMEVLKLFVQPTTILLLKDSFHLFENKIKEVNAQLKKGAIEDTILNEDFFKYMNKYNNNLLAFDELKPVNLEAGKSNLEQFLLLFLGEENISEKVYA